MAPISRTLLLTLFYRFMPELIYEGHVYIAMPPLYKAMPARGEEEYLYDDKALEKYRKTHKGSFTLQRYKGLGEMDAEQLWETTLNPETRILKRVEIEDARMASECDGDADGHGCSAQKGIYLRTCTGRRTGYLERFKNRAWKIEQENRLYGPNIRM